MAEFATMQIGPHAYFINDEGQSSFYVVEGIDRAAVIDTGITLNGTIYPVIRKLTDKPLVLVLTHAHIDHFYHMDEFETVYMNHREFEMGENTLLHMMGGKSLDIQHTIDINTNDIIDLGGEKLESCTVPGHTPGSTVFLAEKQNLLFTGDAIGSGYGVWMQVPKALPLDQYYHSLLHFMKWLLDRGGRMQFYGGHHMQQYLSQAVPHYNPLSLGLLADLIDLVDKIVKHELIGRPSNVSKTFTLEPTLYAAYGRAEIQFLKTNVHSTY